MLQGARSYKRECSVDHVVLKRVQVAASMAHATPYGTFLGLFAILAPGLPFLCELCLLETQPRNLRAIICPGLKRVLGRIFAVKVKWLERFPECLPFIRQGGHGKSETRIVMIARGKPFHLRILSKDRTMNEP